MRYTKTGVVFENLQELKNFYVNRGEIVDTTEEERKSKDK
jgi:hypothetical protein